MGDLILSFDKVIFTFINQRLWVDWVGKVMHFITMLGNGKILLPAVWLLIFLFDRRRFFRYSILIFLSSFFGWEIIQLLKDWVGRPRPYSVLSFVNVIGKPLKMGSFPSGHAQLIFTVATIVSNKYKRFRIPLISMAMIISISRVYLGAHFPLDVFAGGLIGYGVGKLALFIEEIYLKNRKNCL